MLGLNETRRTLESYLTEEVRVEYFALLRQWFLFCSPITKEEFDRGVRKLLVTEEQLRWHNNFLRAIIKKSASNPKIKTSRLINDRGVFENPDYSDFVQPSSPTMVPPPDYEVRSAAAELFIPDSSFIASRIAIAAWENNMEGADDGVTELMVHACQVFVRNIITAMITKKKGYKVRDRKFQFGFNHPVPDPFLRNFNNVLDETQESKIEIEDDTFKPKCPKLSLERAEQQVAFAYSCSKRLRKSDNTLTVKLLYNTIRQNPNILGLHSIQSVSLFKLGLHLDDEKSTELER